MAWRRAIIVVVCALWGAGCITDRVLREDDDGRIVVDDEVVRRAKKTTEARRGLPFARDVPLEVMTSAELTEWLNRYYDQYKASLAVQDRFSQKLGILPPTRDTASVWKGFVGGFAGGLYDTARVGDDGERGTMLLISDYAWWSKVQLDVFGLITGVDQAYEMFLVHELTHALQDQHLRLDRLLSDAPDDDRRMVRKAIIESEANVIGMAHFAGIDLEQTAPRTVFFLFLHYNNLLNGPLMAALSRKTPSFYARQAFSQYELGLSFVDERLTAGARVGAPLAELSRAAVRLPGGKDAYPESTEQLLFAHKRGAVPDRPLTLAPLPVERTASHDAAPSSEDAPAAALFLGYEVKDSGVFGALALKHWLEGPLAIGADHIVDGWGGDRYELLIDHDDETVLVWRLLGDSDGDAAELASALKDRLVAAHGDGRLDVVSNSFGDGSSAYHAMVRPAPDEKRFIRTRRAEHLAIVRRGAAVVVVTGLKADASLDTWLEALFPRAVAVPLAPQESADRVEVAQALVRTLEDSLAALPARAPAALSAQLITPARTIAVGTQQVFSWDAAAPTAPATTWTPPRSFTRVDARWGVRPWLELSGPLGATAHAEHEALFFALGVQGVAVPVFEPFTGRFVSRIIATGGVAAGDVGLTAQVEAIPDGVLAAAELGHVDVRARVGALLRPLPWLVLQPGIEVADTVVERGQPTRRTLRLAGVLQRGFLDAPVIEVEVVGGLKATVGGDVLYDIAPPSARPGLGLTLRGGSVSVGALLTF